MKKLSAFFFSVILCFTFALSGITALAGDNARILSAEITASGFNSTAFLNDKNADKYYTAQNGTKINIKTSSPIGALYIMFALEYGEYTVTNNATGKSITAGTYGCLHEYIDILSAFGNNVKDITLDFSRSSVRLSEVYIFSQGKLPDYVQQWSAPLDSKADMVLFASHGDDDQLYFAGLLPYYAVYKNYNVQVVYLTDHRNLTEVRVHEMLNGLWAVGVRAYPVFGSFADFRIDDLEQTYKQYESMGVTRDDLLGFAVEQIRRFEPLVIVGHDFKGEYGHGMHMLYADIVSKAIPLAADQNEFSESAEKYGTWQIKKAYFHLYEQNQIQMDYDTPQDCFDGLSAFQVTQKLGFPCHVSQQGYSFKPWLNGASGEITKATQIKTYSPCMFGLYYSAVGDDVLKNDMFENAFREVTTPEVSQEVSQEPSVPPQVSQVEIPEASQTVSDAVSVPDNVSSGKTIPEALAITIVAVIVVVVIIAFIAVVFILRR